MSLFDPFSIVEIRDLWYKPDLIRKGNEPEPYSLIFGEKTGTLCCKILSYGQPIINVATDNP